MRIHPADAHVAAGQTLQLELRETDSRDHVIAIKDGVTWAVTSGKSFASFSQPDHPGLLTAMAPGRVTVHASHDGKSVTHEVDVTSAVLSALIIVPSPLTLTVGATQQLTAQGVFSDGSQADVTAAVSWRVEQGDTATVSPTGLARITGAGTSRIVAESGGIKGVASITGTNATLTSLTVKLAPSPAPYVGATIGARALGVFSDQSVVDLTSAATWASSDTSVARFTMDTPSRGKAHVLSPGTVQLTASVQGKMATASVTVAPASLVSLRIELPSPNLPLGQSMPYKVFGRYSDGKEVEVTEQAAPTAALGSDVTVNQTTHAMTGANTGASVVAFQVLGVSAQAAVTVTNTTLVSIEVQLSRASVPAKVPVSATVIAHFADGTTLDVTDAATLTPGGGIASSTTGDHAFSGEAATASGTVDASFQGQTARANVTATSATIDSLALTPASLIGLAGSRFPLHVRGTFSDGQTYDLTSLATVTSADPAVALVEPWDLHVWMRAKGNFTLTTTALGKSLARTGKVMDSSVNGLRIEPDSLSVALGGTGRLKAMAELADGTEIDVTEVADWTSDDLTIVSLPDVTAGTAKPWRLGSTTIHAQFAGHSADASITVVAPPPTAPSLGVTIDAIVTTLGKALAKATGGILPYSFRITSGAASATVDEDSGLVTATATPGNVQVTVRDALNNTASATFDVVAGGGPVITGIAISPATASKALGNTQTYTATATYSDASTADVTNAVTWSSSDTSKATINASGLASTVATGSTNITATLDGVTSNTAALTVTSAVITSIAITPASASVALGDSQQYAATATYSDGGTADVTNTASWSSSATSKATISATGLASTLATGSTNITATLGGVTSNTATLTVTSAVITSIAITPSSTSIALGDSQQYAATATYSDGGTADVTNTASWNSSATSKATISATGLATSVATGSTNITATLGGVTSNTATLVITAAVITSIAISPATASKALGNTQTYTATATYSDASTADVTNAVTWSSSDTSKATINASGLASTLATGSTNITATLGSVTSNTATLTVTSAVVTSIAITPASASIALGDSQQYAATATYSDGGTADVTNTASWNSSVTSKASISASGLASTLATGATNITATLGGVTSNTATLTVTSAVVTSIAITPASAGVALGYTQQYAATATYSDGGTADVTNTASWNSSATSKATISATGLATSVATGSTNITATLGGVTSNTATLTIGSAVITSIAITPSSASIALGYTQQYAATATYSDGGTADVTNTASWNSSATSKATISATGLATSVATGSTNITATLGGVTSNTGSLTITAAVLTSVTVSPGSPSISVGQNQQFTATAHYSDASTTNVTASATWVSSDTGVATIDASGLASAVAAGTTSITATYNAVSSSADTLTVTGGSGGTITIVNFSGYYDGWFTPDCSQVEMYWYLEASFDGTVKIEAKCSAGAWNTIASGENVSSSGGTSNGTFMSLTANGNCRTLYFRVTSNADGSVVANKTQDLSGESCVISNGY